MRDLITQQYTDAMDEHYDSLGENSEDNEPALIRQLTIIDNSLKKQTIVSCYQQWVSDSYIYTLFINDVEQYECETDDFSIMESYMTLLETFYNKVSK